MNKKNIKKNNTLFTLQLKLFNKLVDVEVLTSDDKLSVVHRVCEKNKLDLQYSEQIQQKIMNSLGKVLKQDSVAPALLDKVLKFFHKASYLEDQIELQKPQITQRKVEKIELKIDSELPQKKQKIVLDKFCSQDSKQQKKINKSEQLNSLDSHQKRNQRIYQLINTPPEQLKELKFNNKRKYKEPQISAILQDKIENSQFQEKYTRKRIPNNENNEQDYFHSKPYENSYSKKRNQIKERAKLLQDDYQSRININKNKSEDKHFQNSRSKYSKEILNDVMNEFPENKKEEYINKHRSSNYKLQNHKSNYNTIVQSTQGFQSRLDLHHRYTKPTSNINKVDDTSYYLNKKPRRDLGDSIMNINNTKSSFSIGRKYKYLQQF